MNKELLKEFKNPGVAYRGKPFWSWNGELEKDELVRQVKVMKEMGLGGYFMHSRAGLITEYLGDEWFDLINAVADAGEEEGLESWLYDEDRWPSGSAGGKVTEDPQYSMKSIVLKESDVDKFSWDGNIVKVFAGKVDGFNLDEYFEISKDTDLSKLEGYKILKFEIIPQERNSVYNGNTYIDTMSLKATERFIELTHEEYKKRCEDRIGTTIKGIFTDEPHRGHMLDDFKEVDGVRQCSCAYTDDIFEEFEKRYGYDAKAILPELYYIYKGRKVNKVKKDYVDLANALFIERFAIPVNNWCIENNMELTGHYLHEDSLTNQTVPCGSIMRMYEYMGYPGVDVLTEGNRCYWVVKQLSSVARQLDKKWLLSELYGCTGWQFDFKAHKAVGDWQALFGINLRCHHLSWYTMEGESKRDYPASILHQSAYYPYYDLVESYFARFGVVISSGKPECEVLVLNPIESVWAQIHMGWARWISSVDEDVRKLERHYEELFHMLCGNHIDFDYGEEEMMSRHASVEDGALRVGNARYKVVVVSGMLTMRESTIKLLEEFVEQGGKVIFAGDLPKYVDAVESEKVSELSSKATCIPFDKKELANEIKSVTASRIDIAYKDGSVLNDVFCQVRNVEDSSFIVMLNTDRNNPKDGVVVKYKLQDSSRDVFVEEWDLLTGNRYEVVDYECKNGFVEINTYLNPAGERVFLVTSKKDDSLVSREVLSTKETKLYDGMVDYELDEPNVCVLDFAKWKFNDGEWNDEDEVLKVDAKVRQLNGMETRSGGMLQPWFAKLHDHKVYGDVELEYEFYVDEIPTGDVYIAAERPENWDYSINGVKLACEDFSDIWIDVCFKKMLVPKGAIKLGLNKVTARTSFMRTTNIEAVYVLGSFGVKLDGKKKTITTLPKEIAFENLVNYNLPFYTGCVTYKLNAQKVKSLIGDVSNKRVVLSPKSFTGALVKVEYDGAEPILLGWDPYEADVTEAVREGKDINVTLVCTRRNTFGPLHIVPLHHGAYGPGHFTTGGDSWTDNYNLIDSCIKDGVVFKIKG